MFNADNLIGKQIDQFSIEGFIAKGAMGMVFKAFDSILARTVALKVIPKPGDEDLSEEEATCREEARKRLIQEAKAAGRLTHPNIVTIHSYGETPELQYICMEYVSGKTLAQVLKARGSLPEEEAVGFFEQILMALDAAGKEGIIHRDIKPANIMITDDGRAKVMDFGIAKLPTLSMTVTGMVLGTPFYMSPEQISGRKVDIRSDIFSFGAVCYETLTGRKAFEGQNTATITYKIVQMEPVPPNVVKTGVSPRMGAIISKALAKDPDARYATPGEMLKDLRNLQHLKAEEKSEPEETVFDATVYAPGVTPGQAEAEIEKPADHAAPVESEHPAPEEREEAPRKEEPEKPAAEERPESPFAGIPADEDHAAKKPDAKAPVPPPKDNLPARIAAGVAVLAGIAAVVYLLWPAKETPPRVSVPPAVTTPSTVPSTAKPTTTVPATVKPSTTVPTTVKPSTTLPPATVPPATTTPPPATTVPPATTIPETKPPVEPPPTTVPLPPSTESLLLDAGRLFVNNPGRAQVILEDVLSAHPNNYDATLMLARLLTFKKDYRNAVVQYQKAIRLNAKAPELYFELGSIQLSQADYDGAIQSLETCLTLSPQNRDDVLSSLGFCYMQKNNPEKARSLLQKALEINPGNHAAKSFLQSLPTPTTTTPPPPPTLAPPVTRPPPPTLAPPATRPPLPTRPTQPPPPPTGPVIPRIEGNYTVSGVNPSGSKYSGTAVIRRAGNGFTVEWVIAKQTTAGVGILTGNTFKVAYKTASGATGGGVYTLQGNGVLKGTWGQAGKGSEVLTPAK